MSLEGQGLLCVTYEASETIVENGFVSLAASAAGQYRIANADATGTVFILGIATHAALVGEACEVCVRGWGKHVLGGTTTTDIAVGSNLSADAAGAAEVNATALDNCGAISMGIETGDDKQVPCIVMPGYRTVAAS